MRWQIFPYSGKLSIGPIAAIAGVRFTKYFLQTSRIFWALTLLIRASSSCNGKRRPYDRICRPISSQIGVVPIEIIWI